MWLKTMLASFHLNNREAKRNLNVTLIRKKALPFYTKPTHLCVTLDRPHMFRYHLHSLREQLTSRVALMRELARSG